MRGTLDAAFEMNLMKYFMVQKSQKKKSKYFLKREEGFNRLREDTALGNFGDRALCSSHYAIRGTMLQGILNNCAAFQELWDVILGGKVVIGVEKQMQSFNFF